MSFNFLAGTGIFIFCAYRPPLGSTHSPTQRILGTRSPFIKRPGRATDFTSPTTAEMKNAWSCTSIPRTCLGRGA
jgi:hypothetical protein